MKSELNERTSFTTNFYHTKNSLSVPISYFIIKDTPSPDDRDNMDVQIIHQ